MWLSTHMREILEFHSCSPSAQVYFLLGGNLFDTAELDTAVVKKLVLILPGSLTVYCGSQRRCCGHIKRLSKYAITSRRKQCGFSQQGTICPVTLLLDVTYHSYPGNKYLPSSHQVPNICCLAKRHTKEMLDTVSDLREFSV